MKLNKLLIYLSMSLFFFTCNVDKKEKKTQESIKTTTLSKDNYLIKGQSFTSNTKTVFLYKVLNDSLVSIDSASVKNNAFTFKGSIDNPAYFIIKTNGNDSFYKFLVDNSSIDLFLHDNLGCSTTYSNSEIQKKYKEYSTKISGFKTKGVDLYYNLKGDFSKANIDKLKQQRANLFKEQSDYIVDFISSNPESNFSAILLNDNLNHLPASKLRKLYDGLSIDIKEQEFTKSLNTAIVTLETEEKESIKAKTTSPSKQKETTEYRPNAYAFSGLNPDGKTMSLQSIPKGKVVLLDFWASWCAPCRATNPNLVHLYNKYKNQGFVIMSVSEDKGQGEWISAIYTDNLSWDYHILDKNKSIAFRYGVESIPHKILIDKNGKIASNKISGSALERRIQQLLAE